MQCSISNHPPFFTSVLITFPSSLIKYMSQFVYMAKAPFFFVGCGIGAFTTSFSCHCSNFCPTSGCSIYESDMSRVEQKALPAPSHLPKVIHSINIKWRTFKNFLVIIPKRNSLNVILQTTRRLIMQSTKRVKGSSWFTTFTSVAARTEKRGARFACFSANAILPHQLLRKP